MIRVTYILLTSFSCPSQSFYSQKMGRKVSRLRSIILPIANANNTDNRTFYLTSGVKSFADFILLRSSEIMFFLLLSSEN